MLTRLKDRPPGIDGVRTEGKATKDDYDRVLVPLFEEARRDGRRLRFLFNLGPEFLGFTAGGAWEDARTGLHYMRLFERIAIVTDIRWVRESVRFVGGMMPCPVRVFANSDRSAALEWLGTPSTAKLPYRLVPESGVLVVEPDAPLRSEDFDAVAHVVDPWIESHGALHGVVVHMHDFPGWANLGGFVRHLQFVKDHRRRVQRIAVATDGVVRHLAPLAAHRFTGIAVKDFRYDELDQAIAWASV